MTFLTRLRAAVHAWFHPERNVVPMIKVDRRPMAVITDELHRQLARECEHEM